MSRIVTIVITLALIQLVINQTFCQSNGKVIELGQKLHFNSSILDEEREVWVKLPEGYSNSSVTYPVAYLLDGESNFSFTAGLLDQLEIRSVPKYILVGIVNTNRTLDLTPPTSENNEDNNQGGADNFIKMLDKELIPFIDKNYRTNNFRTLIGHSYGGLFIIHLLSQKIQMFNAYLAISPSLWWDDQKVVTNFEKALKSNPNISGLLFLSMANERGKMLGGLMKLVGILESENPNDLRWEYKVYQNEHHGSVPVISQIEGFHFFYKDWHVPSPYAEYEKYGLGGLKLRADRIKKEFEEEWSLNNEDYSDFLYELNENGKFQDQLDLSLDLIAKGNIVLEFYESAARSYYALNDKKNAVKYYVEAYKLNPGYIHVNKMLDSLDVNKKQVLKTKNISKTALNKYVGQYVQGDSRYSVSLAEDSLIIDANDGYLSLSKKLASMGQNNFYIPEGFYTFHFVTEEDSKTPSHLIVKGTNGWTKKLRKENEANKR